MTATTFAEHLNTKFRIKLPPSEALELELISVDEMGSSKRQERFSVIFRGPLDRGVWQGQYTFEHERLGTFDLFIVPIGREEEGTVYEAVFNRLKKQP